MAHHKQQQEKYQSHNKSQPSLPHINIINNNSSIDVRSGGNKNSSGSAMVNGIIDTHLVLSSTPENNNSSSSTTVLPMHFNHQRNNARTSSSGIWQNNKTGNPAIDPYSHMPQQARTCITTSQPNEVENIEQKHSCETSSMNCMVGNEATKQISCNRNSKENTSLSNIRGVGSGDDGEYRLLSCTINNKNRCRAMSMSTNGATAEECLKNPQTTMVRPKRDFSDHCNPQMPSSSSHNVQSQQFLIPVSLTKNASESSAAITCNGDPRRHEDAAIRCNNNLNNVVDVNRMNVIEFECNQNRSNINNNNGGAVETMSDDLTITSAIETLATTSSSHDSQNKAKYTSEIVTMREKRRRNRRDRRQARTRASSTSEILPDILNNPRPPPYSSLPPQVPSIISTVPVEDTRYVFSLPLVRR